MAFSVVFNHIFFVWGEHKFGITYFKNKIIIQNLISPYFLEIAFHCYLSIAIIGMEGFHF